MCELDPGYTTIVGPTAQVWRLQERWFQLEAVRNLQLGRLEVHDLAELGRAFRDPEVPLVAVVRHPESVGSQVADALQAELTANPYLEAGRVLCEPGFRVRAATASGSAGPAVVTLDSQRVLSGHTLVAQVRPPVGPKVALLDSGDSNNPRDSVVFTSGAPYTARAVDEFGHGTAIADIIRVGKPQAEIFPVNVLDSAGTCPSYDLLNGLIYCLWSDEDFDIVNASLTSASAGPCPSSLGKTIAYLDALRGTTGSSRPVLVAAAGNAPQTLRLGYPALLSSAIVVTALDWSGGPAPYNLSGLPPSQHQVQAPGATASAPFGVATSSSGTAWPLFGTSFAAAFVTAALVM